MTVGARGVARYGSGRVVGADFAERKGCQHISGSAPVTITSSSSSPAAASGARIWRLTVTSSTSGSACIAGASSSLLSSSSTTSMSTMARARTRNSGRAANSGETALRIRDECDFRKTCVHHTDPENTGKKSKKAIYLSSRSARLLSVDRRARARRGDKLVSEGEAAETGDARHRRRTTTKTTRTSFVDSFGSLQKSRTARGHAGSAHRATRRSPIGKRTLETLTRNGLLQLLLDAELVRVPALLLAAVHGARVEAGVAPGGAEEEKQAGQRLALQNFKTCDSPE